VTKGAAEQDAKADRSHRGCSGLAHRWAVKLSSMTS